MLVHVTHAQFDVEDVPVFNGAILNLMCDNDPVEIQHAICQTLEFDYGCHVDYATWEYA